MNHSGYERQRGARSFSPEVPAVRRDKPMHTNHRRKMPSHHKAYFAWASSKQFRKISHHKRRAQARQCMLREDYVRFPIEVLTYKGVCSCCLFW